jgi:hypothetical protein
MMDLQDIVNAIINGGADRNLRSVIDACREREKFLSRGLFHTLKVGDRVRLVRGQKYLQGVLATVVRKNQTKVVVNLDERRGRFHMGVTCPVELLERYEGGN